MKANRLKNSISFIFLALFLATKLIGLHVLTHDDDTDYAVSFESGGSAAELLGDFVDPQLSYLNFPLSTYTAFNALKVQYWLSENVTTASYIRYDNQANATNHDVSLSGDNLVSGAHRTISSGFSNGDLAEGATYDLKFYLVDEHGNVADLIFVRVQILVL